MSQAAPIPPSAPAPHTEEAPKAAPAGGETLSAHALRVLQAMVRDPAIAAVDSAIMLLQWLRKAAGGAQNAEADAGDAGSKKERPGGRAQAAEPAVAGAAPAPGGRLRAALGYLAVLLVGGIAGGALCLELYKESLIVLAVEVGQLEGDLQKQAQAALAARQALDKAQAGRKEAEKTLAALRAGVSVSVPGAQAPRAGDPAAGAPTLQTAASEHPARTAAARNPADCSVIPSDNIPALMDCIHKFNR